MAERWQFDDLPMLFGIVGEGGYQNTPHRRCPRIRGSGSSRTTGDLWVYQKIHICWSMTITFLRRFSTLTARMKSSGLDAYHAVHSSTAMMRGLSSAIAVRISAASTWRGQWPLTPDPPRSRKQKMRGWRS
jgi:hypothetical protein